MKEKIFIIFPARASKAATAAAASVCKECVISIQRQNQYFVCVRLRFFVHISFSFEYCSNREFFSFSLFNYFYFLFHRNPSKFINSMKW